MKQRQAWRKRDWSTYPTQSEGQQKGTTGSVSMVDSFYQIITHSYVSTCLAGRIKAFQEGLRNPYIFRNYRKFPRCLHGSICGWKAEMALGVVSRNHSLLCQTSWLTVQQERLGSFSHCTDIFLCFKDVCNYSCHHVKWFSNKTIVSVLLQKIPSGPRLFLCYNESCNNAIVTVLSNKI